MLELLARERLRIRQEQIQFTRQDVARRRGVVQSRATRLRSYKVNLRSALFEVGRRRWKHSVPDELKRIYLNNIKDRLQRDCEPTYLLDRLSAEQNLNNRMEIDVLNHSGSVEQILDNTSFQPLFIAWHRSRSGTETMIQKMVDFEDFVIQFYDYVRTNIVE